MIWACNCDYMGEGETCANCGRKREDVNAKL